MPRYDLTEFLEDGAITLDGIKSEAHPAGKSYRFASPSAKVGLRLAHLFELGVKARVGMDLDPGDAEALQLDDDEERDLYRQVMGDTFEELKADGVPWTSVQAIFRLLFAQHAAGMDIDAQITASQGEAQARANRATRRATAKKTAGGKSRRASGGSASRTTPVASPDSSTSPNEPEAAAEAV